MDDDKVDDIPMAPITVQSHRLAAARRALKDTGGYIENTNETEDEDAHKEADAVDVTDAPKQVSKRQMDNLVADDGDQDETAVDCSSQPKKIKTAELAKDRKEATKDGLKKVTPATTSAIPGRSSYTSSTVAIAGPSESSLLSAAAHSLFDKAGLKTTCEKPVKNPTTCDIKQMQHIQSVMDELKNVPDITKMINDDTDQTIAKFEQSSSSAPAMVSEGIGGRFQTVNFYWLDIFEDLESPGVLFIFGKVKTPPPGHGYSSGCIIVKNLNRRVFLLPRQTKGDGTPVDYMDVYNEFYTVFAPQLKISSFQCNRSKRRYCFDTKGIPPEAEYMEICYSGTAPVLPQDVKGDTFSHAFGTNTSLMETFLLDKKLKGPSWLQLTFCERIQQDQQQSWSKFEFTCDVSHVNTHPDSSTFPAPTLVLASLQTETVEDSDLKRKVFIFAGVTVHRNFSLQLPPPPNENCNDFFCLINTPPGHTWPNGVDCFTNKRILKMDSESNMLECLVKKLHELDPDVYLDYGIEFSHLLNQLSDLEVSNFSKIGRLHRPIPLAKGGPPTAIPGRLLCDMTTSRIPRTVGNLAELLKKRNGKEQVVASLTSSETKALFKSSRGLESFVKWGMKHCFLKICEMNKLRMLPLIFQSTCIAGSTLYRALHLRSAYRSEYFMLHALAANNYIVPDGCQSLQTDEAAESQIVQEVASVEGFYDNYVLQLRFCKIWLYPSALTKFQELLSNLDAGDGAKEPMRIIQNELTKLHASRKQVKSLINMKDVTEDQMWQYEISLQALWATTCDVIVGCCRNSRFHSKTVKAYAKAQVWDFLLKVKDIVSKLGHKVIYCNESSVIIQTHSREISTVLKLEKKIQQEIEQNFSLVLACNGCGCRGGRIYRCLLLLKDNKYAGLLYDPNSESKYAFDLEHFAVDPSGELPSIVCKTARACLIEILSEQPLCDKIYKVCKILWDVSSRLRYGTLPLEELLLSKTLTMNPEEYDSTPRLDHVTVALRVNKYKKLGKKFRKGDQVSYVLCKYGRPRHLSEMKSMKDEEMTVKVDAHYYLTQIIHPVVTEICERIPGLGFDSARVSDALGLGG